MALKRKRSSTPMMNKRRKMTPRRRRVRKLGGRSRLAKAVKSVMLRTCETKIARFQTLDTALQKNITYYFKNILSTTSQGVQDPDAIRPSAWVNRIGDEIYVKGIKVKLLFEFQSPVYDAQVMVIVFSHKAGTDPTDAVFWKGLDGVGGDIDRRLDAVSNESSLNVRVIKRFIYKPRAVSIGNTQILSQPHSFWIPWNRKVKYLNESTVPQDRNISIAFVAHNFQITTLASVTNLDVLCNLYFKDP